MWRTSIGTALVILCAGAAWSGGEEFFAIQVVDGATGRGVPLVTLETVNHIRWVTDSNGLAAINEPGLMGQRVFFSVHSHGYSYPKDGFGYAGKALDVNPGGQATIKMTRENVAERLYRVTGGGIYRDTVLLGRTPPLAEPILNGHVLGCDSVLNAIYNGKIYWFWGDTNRPGHPLGNFNVTGATSLPPESGGLDPGQGVDFIYFTKHDGDMRPLAKMDGKGPTWLGAPVVLREADGTEGLYANYVKVRNFLEAYRWGIVRWDDTAESFVELAHFDTRPKALPKPQSHTFIREEEGVRYVYFACPFPLTRVAAEPDTYSDPERYEGFTCLVEGTESEERYLDRDSNGRLRYAWKRNTPPLLMREQAALVKAGLIRPGECLLSLRDAETGAGVQAHNGSAHWNAYRRRWVMIAVEEHGTPSQLGEIWYAEADTPEGPWVYARKVVSHEKCSFYNPKHHPYFDQDGGRTLYFEGTYTTTFSGNSEATPRYDYNQIMYRLNLADPRMNLPVAFYASSPGGNGPPFSKRQTRKRAEFFALERPGNETVPVSWHGKALVIGGENPLFHALPVGLPAPLQAAVPLYQFISDDGGQRAYSTDPDWARQGFLRSPAPLCCVWPAPEQEYSW